MRQFKLRERLGFEFIRQKGSHVVLKKQTPDEALECTVPLSRQLVVGTLGGILRLSQVTPEEFLENL